MKYRMLTKEEQIIFDEDFKAFLITNGVHAEEWAEMNKSDVPKATELVELFSDIVLEKVYQKIEYLEYRSVDSCLVFQCTPDDMKLISITPKQKDGTDLSTPESIHEALTKNAQNLTVLKTSKQYSPLREMEIHKMIEQGCVASSKEFWNALERSISVE